MAHTYRCATRKVKPRHLQQNANLATANWMPNTNLITMTNGINSITITAQREICFFA